VQPTFKPSDFVIFSPIKAGMLNLDDMPPNQFYLVSVLEDKGDNFDFEVLLSGHRALCEAIAISACKKGQRVWLPNESPFGDSNS
jgi:hypothetical protein